MRKLLATVAITTALAAAAGPSQAAVNLIDAARRGFWSSPSRCSACRTLSNRRRVLGGDRGGYLC